MRVFRSRPPIHRKRAEKGGIFPGEATYFNYFCLFLLEKILFAFLFHFHLYITVFYFLGKSVCECVFVCVLFFRFLQTVVVANLYIIKNGPVCELVVTERSGQSSTFCHQKSTFAFTNIWFFQLGFQAVSILPN